MGTSRAYPGGDASDGPRTSCASRPDKRVVRATREETVSEIRREILGYEDLREWGTGGSSREAVHEIRRKVARNRELSGGGEKETEETG